ncbi:MAG: hypothetical protein JW976_14250 [Syntrophaceae bacterium]|nr:hypothetical protein [Syntrophaceae bacterium]
MTRYFKIISVLIGIFVLFCASLANAGAYYKTVEQPPTVSAQIKGATEFSVLPIDYSAIDPKDLGYTNDADWNADKNQVPQAFADSFPVLIKETNVSNKKVSMVKIIDKPTKGIIAEVAVTKINLNWNYWTGRPDEYVCKITFTNAADGQKLYSGVVEVSSFSGNPFTHAWGMSFSGRMQSAAYNIAWVLTKIMTDGKVDPPEY